MGFLHLLALSQVLMASQANGEDVQARVSDDVQKGNPIVVHVVVALCDNRFQGIVPVPKAIGNGQDPASNLYWGASHGLRSFLTRKGSWGLVRQEAAPSAGVLERVVLRKLLPRRGRAVPVYLVAEAWDGKEIKTATVRFLSMAAGRQPETLDVQWKKESARLRTAGDAHLVAYIGHDGLMDFTLAEVPEANPQAPSRSSVVLACASKAFFQTPLSKGGSHPLLLTTNLMAPEAYTLDAAVTAWVRGDSSARVREAAAAAYATYQKISVRAARGLFTGEP